MSKIIEFIENLQNKPRAARMRILWLSVFVCMILVVSFWVIAFDYSAKEGSGSKSDFGAFSTEAKNSVKDIKDQWPQVRAGIKGGANSLFDNATSTKANPFNP
jgi:hypothetical protein